jgi:MYXO-CTERM domain-containing protein
MQFAGLFSASNVTKPNATPEPAPAVRAGLGLLTLAGFARVRRKRI